MGGTRFASKSGKRSHPRRTARSREAGCSRKSRSHEPLLKEKIRPGSIAYDLDGAIEEELRTASPAAAFISGANAIVPVLLALLPFGLAFGATAAGAAQLAAVQLIAAGASVAVVVLTVLVINLRMTLYSASLAPHFRRLPVGWKCLLSYHLTDQAYAATITRFDGGEVEERDKRWYFLGVGLAVWLTWQAATMLGVFLGAWASEGWSLDFVLPLTFIALALPAIKDCMAGAAALSAGVAAVFAASLPLNLGLITAALVGVLGGLVAESVIQSRRG